MVPNENMTSSHSALPDAESGALEFVNVSFAEQTSWEVADLKLVCIVYSRKVTAFFPIRGHVQMTSAKFLGFLTPSLPLSELVIFSYTPCVLETSYLESTPPLNIAF